MAERKRYRIMAKRRDTNEEWTDWADADTYKKAVGSAEKEERRVLKILLPDTPKYFKGAVIPYGRGMKVELVKVLSSQYCTEDMPSLYGSQLLGHEGETCYWWEIREV